MRTRIDRPARAVGRWAARARALAARDLVATVAWTCLVLFSLLAVGAPLLGHGVFLGTENLLGYAPWSSAGAPTLTNTWIGDTIDFYVPQTTLLKESVQAGDIRWWNPFVIGGTPLGALPDLGLFSPMSWLWFVLPTTLATAAVKLVEIAVAATGMALFTRRLGLSSGARAVAALVFVSSGFMIAWTNWPHTRVAALIPLLFWAVDRVLVLRRRREVLALGLVVASMLLTGFPAVVGYAAYAVLGYAVVRLVSLHAGLRAWLRSAALGVTGALLGAGLAAWQMVPFALHALSTIDFEARAQNPERHLSWLALATTAVPQLIGDVSDHAESFWIVRANPVESLSYVGAAAVVLVVAALATRQRTRDLRMLKVFAVAVVVVCIALIYGGGPLLGLAQQLPIFSNNSVARLRVVLGFALALAAGLGFHALVARDDPVRAALVRRGRPGGRPLRWAAAAATGLAVAVLVALAARATPAGAAGTVRPAVVTAAVAAVVCVLVLVLAAVRPGRAVRGTAGAVVAVLVAGQALVVTQTWWPRSDTDTFYPVTPTHEFLAEHLGPDRYVGVGWTMLPGTSSQYSLRSATGHGFHTREWTTLLTAAEPRAMATRTNSTMSMGGLTSPVLDRMAVRYGVDDPEAALAGTLAGTSSPVSDVAHGEVATTQPISGGIRGVQLVMPQGVDLGDATSLTLRAVDPWGTVLATTTRPTASTTEPFGAWIALAAEEIAPDQTFRLTLSADGADLVLPTDAQGGWAVGAVRPADDGLTVVHTGDATVYQRDAAASRLRWAADEVVIGDEDERLAAIASGEVPVSTVVLQERADAQGLPGTSTATLETLADDGDTITVRVDADGAGWLVVADSVRGGGWSASLDGAPVDLVPADQAMAAVRVPGGVHTVEVRYDPPGLRVGAAVTAVALLLVLASVGVLLRRRRTDRAPAAAPVPSHPGEGAEPGPRPVRHDGSPCENDSSPVPRGETRDE
ncbi:YfhO family protein [Cellulomonas sp. ACRRI]|uniref:DUF6044 family protein n=1 Tax=Cellulomonas sp. ACRRI TaxID=2918188 RepID=UPI001EF1D8CE|nr:DUF6044 family protein [Cellulomonas sp. ACRRI]MCG7286822.1 YfhO family protein [Cellulomonas sp. ACRRI]